MVKYNLLLKIAVASAVMVGWMYSPAEGLASVSQNPRPGEQASAYGYATEGKAASERQFVASSEPCSPVDTLAREELTRHISDPYHPPRVGSDERHQGVDFAYYRLRGMATIEGASVRSIFPGRVAATLRGTFPYGNFVIIETPVEQLSPELVELLEIGPGEALYGLFAHMRDAPLVSLGESVGACHKLGLVGKSGNAGAAHLHLETRIGPKGMQFTSLGNFVRSATPEARENYHLWRTSGIFNHFDPMMLLKIK